MNCVLLNQPFILPTMSLLDSITTGPHTTLVCYLLLPEPQPVTVEDPFPFASGLRPPQRFQWRRQSHRLVRWTGPERLTPAWWEQSNGHLGTFAPDSPKPPVTKDYFHVEDEEGRQFWMARTCSSPTAPFGDRAGQAAGRPEWTMEGLFA